MLVEKIIKTHLILFLLLIANIGLSQSFDEQFNKGQYFYNSGNIDSALFYFQKAYKLNPNSEEAINNICASLIEKDETEKAIKMINEALKKFPENHDFLYFKGYTYFRNKDYKRAHKYYSKYIKLDSLESFIYMKSDSYLNRGKCNYYLKKYNEGYTDILRHYELEEKSEEAFTQLINFLVAIKDLNKIIYHKAQHYQYLKNKFDSEILSNYTECEMGMLSLLYESNTLDSREQKNLIDFFRVQYFGNNNMHYELITDLFKLYNRYPNSPLINRLLLGQLVVTNNIDKHEDVIYSASALNPNIYTVQMEKAMYLYRQNEYDDCYSTLEKIISINKSYSPAFAMRGEIKTKRKQYEGAILDFSFAIKLTPKRSTNYLQRGKLYLQLKKYDLAIVDFKNTLTFDAIDDMYSWTYTELGKAYLKIKKPDSALVFFEKAYAKSPDDYNNILGLGETYMHLKQYKNAIDIYSKGIDLTGGEPILFGLRGKAYMVAKDYKSAIKDFELINSIRETPMITYDLGSCYYRLDNYNEKALTYLKRAIVLAPDKASYYVTLGWAYYLRNEFKNSIKYSELALEIDAKNSIAGYNLALVYLRLKKFSLARTLYKDFAEINFKEKGKITQGAIEDLKKLLKDGEVPKKEIDYILTNILTKK
jgi:tetratricopeptide (TPR) repeat protein